MLMLHTGRLSPPPVRCSLLMKYNLLQAFLLQFIFYGISKAIKESEVLWCAGYNNFSLLKRCLRNKKRVQDGEKFIIFQPKKGRKKDVAR